MSLFVFILLIDISVFWIYTWLVIIKNRVLLNISNPRLIMYEIFLREKYNQV